MAFNLHLPGSDMLLHMSWMSKDFEKRRKKALVGSYLNNCTMYDYKHKIGYFSSSLCFQSDIIYPNAFAAVSRVSCEDDCFVLGCKGNQIHQDFPLQPRVPVAVPLIQYPSNVFEFSRFEREMDICAKPVLNWEKYIQNVKGDIRHNYELWPRRKGKTRRKNIYGNYIRQYKKHEKNKKSADDQKPQEEYTENADKNISNDTESESSGDDLLTKKCQPQPSTSSAGRNKGIPKRKISRPELKNMIREVSLHRARSRNITQRRIQRREEAKDLLSQGKTPEWKNKLDLSKVEIRESKIRTEAIKQKYILASLNKFKNQPDFRVEATWNHIYGGLSGTCCYIESPVDQSKNVFIACQSQLRKAVLKKSEKSSMLSYKLKSVWEEDLLTGTFNNDDTIFQIVPSKNSDMIGVRRGKRIGIYSVEDDCPYLLDCIPNICYGTREYDGWKKRNHIDVYKDPLLLGFDFNPQYAPEFITIDENMQIRVCDLTKGKTVSTFGLSKSPRFGPGFKGYPKFKRINDASGIQFSTYGEVFFAWSDSKVTLGDRRDLKYSRASLIDNFDLRRSTSSISWSSQMYFNDTKPELNEYISSLRKSEKEYYYYVGTTNRILLMDLRVPGQPVLQMEHGMGSAATYLDTYTNELYEVVVAASQRMSTTFCAITDHAHVSCTKDNRPSCEAKNPVLNCLPRHLSNSKEFFDVAFSEGFGLTWEADHRRAMNHNYAWTTGLSITKGPIDKNMLGPPGILVFTTNCFGDVFLQEWEHGPIECHRKTELQDYKFTHFLEQWRDSMKSKTITEFQKPTLNPKTNVDCSLLLEPCARRVRRMKKVREKPFDVFNPNVVRHHYLEETQTRLEDRIKQLRKFKSKRDNRFIDYWETNDDISVDEVQVKQEEDELQKKYENNINNDGTYDIEYIHYTPREREEIIELENQIRNEIRRPFPKAIKNTNKINEEESMECGSEAEELLSIDSKADISDTESDDSEIEASMTYEDHTNKPRKQYNSTREKQSYDTSAQSKPSTGSASTSAAATVLNALPTAGIGHRWSKSPTLSESEEEEDQNLETAKPDDTEWYGQTTSSRSPDLWSQQYLQDYGKNTQQGEYDESQETRRQEDEEEYGDFIPQPQPKHKKGVSRRSGF